MSSAKGGVNQLIFIYTAEGTPIKTLKALHCIWFTSEYLLLRAASTYAGNVLHLDAPYICLHPNTT